MKKQGFTLLELMIAIAVLAILGALVFMMLKSMSDSYSTGSLHGGLNSETRDLLDRIAAETADAGITTLVPAFPNGSTTLAFRRNTGYAGGAIVFGAPITYAFVYEPGELNNGIDDNGDGRIDEGRLVRTENGDPVILSRDLAENGITFTQTGNTIRVILTIEKVDEKRQVVRYTRETTIQIRN